MNYEAVIGLEIHLQLNSVTKMFCDCPNSPGDQPNQNICPICLWLPGTIPMFSREVLEKAALTCLALNCRIRKESAFDQKVYYYPDLPKGFQLSQFHKPLSENGWLDIIGEEGQSKRLRIRNIHMEEDVAKLVHETEGRTRISLVDFNRAGAPLVEIVTEPDMQSPYDAMELIRALRRQIRYVGSSECSMEQGTMRVDANISLRPRGSNRMNTKVEVKNMNSIRNIGDAISYEINRQEARLIDGEPIVLHTRLWDPEKCVTTAMRGKFEGPCVPDPCVTRIVVSDEWLAEMKLRLPEMPGKKAERFIREYGLAHDEAALMSSERELSEYFEEVVKEDIPPRTATHWIATQMVPLLKERNETLKHTSVTSRRLAALLTMLERDEINTNLAKKVFLKLFDSEDTPEAIVEQSGLKQISDTPELEKMVAKIIADNPGALDDLKSGKEKAMGFIIGQVMQISKGKANPKLIREILLSKL